MSRVVAGRLVAAGAALVIAGCGAVAGASRPAPSRTATTRPTPSRTATTRPAPSRTASTKSAPTPPASARRAPPTPRRLAHPSAARRPPFAIGRRVVTFVDRSRRVRFPGGRPAPRRLVTLVRFPATRRGGPPDRAAGPFPLVVFGHGFAVTPEIYGAMLDAWARAGYVVAAPVFPLENADAPGGPDESDLVNQPRDMSLVITRLLTADAVPGGALAGLIAPRAIAVAGQSDGGETALAVAYDRYYRDSRVRAAIILSGAVIPGVGGFDFPPGSPPLLATQGTADTINPPRLTRQFFDLAPRPKYLLTLFGASHLGPYTDAQPQLGVVERVSVAFLDQYLKNAPGAAARLAGAGNVPGIARLGGGG